MSIEDLERQLGLSNDTEAEEDEGKKKELDDILNLLNGSEDDDIVIDSNSDKFEGLSQEELDILMREDESIDIDDIDIDAINDISVYDNKEDVPEEEILEKLDNLEMQEELSQEQDLSEDESISLDDLNQDDSLNSKEELNQENIEKNNVKEKKSPQEAIKKLVSISKKENTKHNSDKLSILIIGGIVFLIILILVTIIFFTVAINKVNNNTLTKKIEKDTLIAKYTPSDKNTVYFDSAKTIDEETIILEKVKVDKVNTTFYFKNKIDITKYNIVLTDESYNLYALDLNFTQDGENEDYSILRFSPINGTISNLTLYIQSVSSGEKIKFDLDFNMKLEDEKIKYINSRANNSFGDFEVNVNYAIFSETSTRVDYTIQPKDDAQYYIQQGVLGETNYIKLKENNVEIHALSDIPISTTLDNKIIGRMDFENINSHNSTIVLQFDNIYKKYLINEKVSLNSINSKGVSYEFDKYKLVLENMPKFDNKYVLVAHAKDTTISTENRADDYNHTEVKLDVEITATSSDGVEVIISPTEIKSASYGTDIIFELDDSQMSILNNISTSDLSVNVKSALMKEKSVSVPIDIKRSMDRETLAHQIVEEQIANYFNSRIQNNTSKNIKGFSNEVLNNEKLSSLYYNLPKGKKQSYVNVVSRNIENDYLEAIIQEAIQVKDGDNVKVYYRIHKIKANNVENQWTIYYDEIIKQL